MTTKKFYRTSDARWYAAKERNGPPGTERQMLWELIQRNPGLHTSTIIDEWPFTSSVTSRLMELHDEGYLTMQKAADLFEQAK